MKINNKKICIVISIILAIIIIGILCLKYIPFGTTTYKMPNSNITLEIPKLSIFENECCMFSASFKSFRSKAAIQKELDNIISKYEKKTCNNKTVYYDSKQEIRIYDYSVEYGFPMNTFYITYDKGNYDVNDCSIVTNPKELTYGWQKCIDNICYHNNIDNDKIVGKYQYKNKDGKLYNLYLDVSNYLTFQTGTGTKNTLESMLLFGWISMQDVIDFLEYQVENKTTIKETYLDGGSTVYKSKDFWLLNCNTTDGNKDIYIGDTDFEYKEKYCK